MSVVQTDMNNNFLILRKVSGFSKFFYTVKWSPKINFPYGAKYVECRRAKRARPRYNGCNYISIILASIEWTLEYSPGVYMKTIAAWSFTADLIVVSIAEFCKTWFASHFQCRLLNNRLFLSCESPSHGNSPGARVFTEQSHAKIRAALHWISNNESGLLSNGNQNALLFEYAKFL